MKKHQPLKLKKPKPPKNWYRNGRWHKVYPRPGFTQYRKGDLCQFKPDLLEVEVESVYETAKSGILLYSVRCLNTGHVFSTYGNDLFLLERYKPQIILKEKSKLVFNPKPVVVKKKSVLVIRKPLGYIKPDKDVIARLSFVTLWGGENPDPHWAFIDFKKGHEKELENTFWKRVEESPYRLKSLKLYGRNPKYWSAVTDRRKKEHWVCIEWFDPQYKFQPNRKAKRGTSKSRSDVLSGKKTILHGKSKRNGAGVPGRNQEKRIAQPNILPQGKSKQARNGKSRKTRTDHRRKK